MQSLIPVAVDNSPEYFAFDKFIILHIFIIFGCLDFHYSKCLEYNEMHFFFAVSKSIFHIGFNGDGVCVQT